MLLDVSRGRSAGMLTSLTQIIDMSDLRNAADSVFQRMPYLLLRCKQVYAGHYLQARIHRPQRVFRHKRSIGHRHYLVPCSVLWIVMKELVDKRPACNAAGSEDQCSFAHSDDGGRSKE